MASKQADGLDAGIAGRTQHGDLDFIVGSHQRTQLSRFVGYVTRVSRIREFCHWSGRRGEAGIHKEKEREDWKLTRNHSKLPASLATSSRRKRPAFPLRNSPPEGEN